MKIVISEYLHQAAVALLEERSQRIEAVVRYRPELYHQFDALTSELKDADALIVRNQTRVDDALLSRAPELRVVGRVGVGLDNLDLTALRARGVTTTWAPGTNAVSVAEYVMGAMLEHFRRFATASARLHRGEWNRQAAIGVEAYGKTLGIVGLGDIGSRLAKRARAFGMRVLASDPLVHHSSFAVQEYEVELTSLTDLLGRADVVSLHVPLVPSTHHLIGAGTLQHFKSGALLINTARGGLIDETALAAALQNGTLAAATLDVREHEPPGEQDPLRGLTNVTLTPHVAGLTEEASRRSSLHVAEDVLLVLSGQRPLSEVPSGA
ncbi:MAG: hydroxyacid dehydrogenase [Trueperaceae bacterium]|nr:MAG: hydroxyacid dehydrogenase [Trueperaceae bacterium]